MTCPRGEHGFMFKETHPTAYYCLTCGYRAYPGFEKRLGSEEDDNGYGARQTMSPKQKRQRAEIIGNLVSEGYRNTEIAELTGYTKGIIEKIKRTLRKGLDNVSTHV